MTPNISDDAFRQAGALIDDTVTTFEPPTIDGHKMSMGLAPRDFDAHPMFANGAEFPDHLLIPESDLKNAFEDQRGQHATLFDLRERAGGALDSLDQNGFGLCWYFSTTKANMYARAIAGLPMLKLSPWWGAGKINKWADRGGWCERSMAHAVQYGQPLYDLCPKYSREYDTPEVEKAALDHQVIEFWETSENKDKRAHQVLSAAFRGFPMACDYNHMSHSMAFCCIPRFASLGDFDLDCDNSWGMKSGVKGIYRLKGWKARPDSCVIARVSKATDK